MLLCMTGCVLCRDKNKIVIDWEFSFLITPYHPETLTEMIQDILSRYSYFLGTLRFHKEPLY